MTDFQFKIAGRTPCLIVLAFLAVCIGFSSRSLGAEGADASTDISDLPRFELEEIVVTAAKTEAPVKSVPKNVTVITREDIEQAPSNNVVDLLNREAGINLRSLFGNDKQAVIDVRGMGATAGSNIVVMVDGIKINAPDMSGVDFSTVLLEQVERIEIVRGAGSVIYGDGAVGGVINIVTQKGKPETERSVYASYGSYSTADVRASVTGSVKELSYNISAGYFDSRGYRENGDYGKRGFAGVADYYLNDTLSFNFSGGFHEDAYGLPGPVSIDDIDSRDDRLASEYPDDYGETTDARFSGGVAFDTDGRGSIKIVRGYRQRNNDFLVGYSPLIPEDDQISEIEEFTKTLNLSYELDFTLFHRDHKFQAGADHHFTDYVREEAPGGPRINSRIRNYGLYVNNQWSLTESLRFQWGYRENQTDVKLREDQLVSTDGIERWANGETENRNWRKHAYDLGLTYLYSKHISFFSSYGTSFRVPNTDELAESESGLKPQTGSEWDIGGRFKVLDRLELTLTFFHIKTEDEIYYSEINRNYDDQTIRSGLETDARFYWTQSIFLWGNYSYTEATLEGADTDIPLVPRHKGSTGIEWIMLDGLNLSLTGTFVGSRYDGNDIDNDRYEKLDAYSVFDGKATYQRGNCKLFAGVNNLFDTLYATYAYSESYYTMPGRNVYGGVEWVF
jgi:outer membrane receptor protein involved in Fe transport